MMNTTMVAKSGMPARSTVDEGASAVVHLVTAKDVGSGKYFNGMREARANQQAYDDAARAKLRAISEELTRKR